jgi:hypothetical protein
VTDFRLVQTGARDQLIDWPTQLSFQRSNWRGQNSDIRSLAPASQHDLHWRLWKVVLTLPKRGGDIAATKIASTRIEPWEIPEFAMASPFHRAELVIAVLVLLQCYRGCPQCVSAASVANRFLEIEVLDGEVVVAVFVRSAD